jgi:hypothetical protein
MKMAVLERCSFKEYVPEQVNIADGVTKLILT